MRLQQGHRWVCAPVHELTPLRTDPLLLALLTGVVDHLLRREQPRRRRVGLGMLGRLLVAEGIDPGLGLVEVKGLPRGGGAGGAGCRRCDGRGGVDPG